MRMGIQHLSLALLEVVDGHLTVPSAHRQTLALEGVTDTRNSNKTNSPKLLVILI